MMQKFSKTHLGLWVFLNDHYDEENHRDRHPQKKPPGIRNIIFGHHCRNQNGPLEPGRNSAISARISPLKDGEQKIHPEKLGIGIPYVTKKEWKSIVQFVKLKCREMSQFSG